MQIKLETRGFHSGQLDQTLYVDQGGKIIAYLDFSEFENIPHVQFIWVDPKERRNGHGVALIRHLQSLYPETEIDFGSLTDEGSRLISSLKFATITDPKLAKLFALQAKVKAKLAHLDTIPPEEQIAQSAMWNRLHDMEHSLEQQLWDKKPTKQIVEQDLMEKINRAPVYHSLKMEYAERALRENELLATSTQRFWPDGKRRKENWEGYQESFWMKGVSLTRDIRFALRWSDVTFILDLEKIRQKVKVVPFAWNYHFRDDISHNPNHKKEREEFAIVTQRPDRYQIQNPNTGKIELDYDRFVEPEGSIPNLNSFLMGIIAPSDMYLSDKQRTTHYRDKSYDVIVNHPKFLGFVDRQTGKLFKPDSELD